MLAISLENEEPKIDPYLCDVIPVDGEEVVATESFIGNIKEFFRGKIDLRWKEGATYQRNLEKSAQIRERLAHKGDIKKGKEKLPTKLYVEDLFNSPDFVIDFDSFKELFAKQKAYTMALFKDIEPAAKDLVAKYKEAMTVSETDLDKAHQILMDNVGLYLPKKYTGEVVEKVSNYVSLTKTHFGHICLKLWTNDAKLYFAVIDSHERFKHPKNVHAMTKAECLEALDIVDDYHKTLFELYEKIWSESLKDYHKSLDAFRNAHSGWKKLPANEQDKLGRIADVVYEVTTDFRPLAGVAASVLNATRAAQYAIVYSMESQENI